MRSTALTKTQHNRSLRSGVPGSIEIWQPSGLNSLEMRRGTLVTQPYPRHWHEEFELCLVTGGQGYLDWRGASHFAPTGSLFLMPPSETHANRACKGGCSFLNIYIPASLIDDVVAELTERRPNSLPSVSKPLIEDPQIRRGFLDLYQTLESSPSCAQQESSLFAFLANLITRHTYVQATVARGGIQSRAVRVTCDF